MMKHVGFYPALKSQLPSPLLSMLKLAQGEEGVNSAY